MMADHLDFLDFAGGGNSGMEQSIESIGLQYLLTGFSFFSQNVPFFICEADHDLVVPQAMGFGFYAFNHFVPSFHLRSKLLWGFKGERSPLASFPGGRCEKHRPYPGSLLDGRSEANGYPGGETCLPSLDGSGVRALPGEGMEAYFHSLFRRSPAVPMGRH